MFFKRTTAPTVAAALSASLLSTVTLANAAEPIPDGYVLTDNVVINEVYGGGNSGSCWA